ncbi:MAG: NADH-ubiquinone oxidoreductase-F iron-sulfur binding region domain-containing protein [Candidatus Omnitrophota bacterium]
MMSGLETRVLLPQDLKPVKSLKEYKAQGGFTGLEKARKMTSEELIDFVTEAGLRGRGGAGFPTGIKWDTVYMEESKKKYVVCNFAEGEPGTYKDRYLISKNPYLMFEGMLIAAHAVKAKQAIVGTKKKFSAAVQRITQAMEEIEKDGIVEPGFLKIVLGPDEYLFGEEKALLEVIDGREPMPRLFPPYMVGVGWTPTENNPTVVNNAESMSHLPLILKNGIDWFKSRGTKDTPGTMIISLSGDVKNPGMYEISLGIKVKELLYDLGGGPVGRNPFKAVFSGVANRVMTPDQFDLAIDFGTLRANGVGLGSGGFMVYDESRWMVDLTWMFSHFLAQSSCGQCIPCNMGTRVITQHLLKIHDGIGTREDLEAIIAETKRCTNQTRCFLPVQESVLVPSCMEKFAEEFEPGFDVSGFDREIIIPKIESFDDTTGQFTFEKTPKEFLQPK